MSDDRTFIEKTQERSRLYHGRELSPEEMSREFMKLEIDDRVNHLEQLSGDHAYDSPGEAAKHHSYRQALRDTHERLRKVGR
jgi:hypothetical protein